MLDICTPEGAASMATFDSKFESQPAFDVGKCHVYCAEIAYLVGHADYFKCHD